MSYKLAYRKVSLVMQAVKWNCRSCIEKCVCAWIRVFVCPCVRMYICKHVWSTFNVFLCVSSIFTKLRERCVGDYRLQTEQTNRQTWCRWCTTHISQKEFILSRTTLFKIKRHQCSHTHTLFFFSDLPWSSTLLHAPLTPPFPTFLPLPTLPLTSQMATNPITELPHPVPSSLPSAVWRLLCCKLTQATRHQLLQRLARLTCLLHGGIYTLSSSLSTSSATVVDWLRDSSCVTAVLKVRIKSAEKSSVQTVMSNCF